MPPPFQFVLLPRLLKYGFGVSLLGAVPLTLYPLHDTFAPWLALCSPQYSAAAKAAEAQGHSMVQLSPLQDSMLTTGIMGGWDRTVGTGWGCEHAAIVCTRPRAASIAGWSLHH